MAQRGTTGIGESGSGFFISNFYPWMSHPLPVIAVSQPHLWYPTDVDQLRLSPETGEFVLDASAAWPSAA